MVRLMLLMSYFVSASCRTLEVAYMKAPPSAKKSPSTLVRVYMAAWLEVVASSSAPPAPVPVPLAPSSPLPEAGVELRGRRSDKTTQASPLMQMAVPRQWPLVYRALKNRAESSMTEGMVKQSRSACGDRRRGLGGDDVT